MGAADVIHSMAKRRQATSPNISLLLLIAYVCVRSRLRRERSRNSLEMCETAERYLKLVYMRFDSI